MKNISDKRKYVFFWETGIRSKTIGSKRIGSKISTCSESQN